MKIFYSEKDITLFHGDCLDVLATIPENSVDMIFADPPYFLSNGGFTVHAGKMISVNKGSWDRSGGVEADFAFHKKWIDACRRVLKPEGTIWISGTYHSIYACGFALQTAGFHMLNDIAWFKPNAAPNLSCRFFTASHETLLWARKSKAAKHVFNYDEMKEGDWREDSIKQPGKQMRSVWSVGTPKTWEKVHGKHPTQKPVDLLKRIVLASTHKGATVLDPFNGGGTTGVAVKMAGRKYIGIDKDETYLSLSLKRYTDLLKSVPGKLC